jgi:hypothetical protein
MNTIIHTQTAAKRTAQVLAAAMAITAAGLLTAATPAQAHPMLPLAPPCSQYGFGGGGLGADFSIRQDNGFQTFFTGNGASAGTGRAVSIYKDNVTEDKGNVTGGGIQGRNVDFTIRFDAAGPIRYTGTVGNDGFVHGGQFAGGHWDSINGPLACLDAPPPAPAPPAPAQQPAPPAQTPGARLGVAVNGPTTLPAGLSGTYTVSLSNSGDTGAPVELYVSYGGQLQQTGQVTPSGGFNCDVVNYAGGTSAVHCTVPQFQSKATANIVVQGRGSAPGAGHLTATINSSDPGAQFVQKSQPLNISIT